jgi:hypothetical protein
MFGLSIFVCSIGPAKLWDARTSAWDEIESVVASGKEVTIHEAPISKHSFTGSGYIVVDPQTGAGAYLIEGGARGCLLLIAGSAIMTLAATLLVGANPVAALAFLAAGVAITLAGASLLNGDSDQCAYFLNVAVNLIAVAFVALGALGIIGDILFAGLTPAAAVGDRINYLCARN